MTRDGSSEALDNRYAVVLPCEPPQFRNFIAGLLGRPQTITRHLSGPFDVTKDDITNLHQLISQRLGTQNDATLVQFTATITYDDRSSVLLNSYDDFMNYAEVKPLTSVSISVGWTFLIKFFGREFPEKQGINVTFASGVLAWDEAYTVGIEFPTPRARSGILLKIEHTNRTWGVDLEALLAGNLASLVVPVRGLRGSVAKNAGWWGIITGISLFILGLILLYRNSLQFFGVYAKRAEDLRREILPDLTSMSKKLDFIVDLTASGTWEAYFSRLSFYTIGLLVFSIIASVIVGGMASDMRRPSFVVLTARAESRRQERMRRYDNHWIFFLASIAIAVAINVFSSYIFQYLSPQPTP